MNERCVAKRFVGASGIEEVSNEFCNIRNGSKIRLGGAQQKAC